MKELIGILLLMVFYSASARNFYGNLVPGVRVGGLRRPSPPPTPVSNRGRLCRYGVNYWDCCRGWRKDQFGVCNPVCQKQCVHGECVAPDRCECEEGWMGPTCEKDFNECAVRPCQHRCMNQPGSYRCYCEHGYALMPDSHRCQRDKRCLSKHCSFACKRKGRKIECACPPGWQLAPDGKNCRDIDECSTGTANCGPDLRCQNSMGDYICLCPLGQHYEYSTLLKKYKCENDKGCEQNPCFPGVTCTPQAKFNVDTRFPVPEHVDLRLYRCGPCPEGFEGDGEICTPKIGSTDTPRKITQGSSTDSYQSRPYSSNSTGGELRDGPVGVLTFSTLITSETTVVSGRTNGSSSFGGVISRPVIFRPYNGGTGGTTSAPTKSTTSKSTTMVPTKTSERTTTTMPTTTPKPTTTIPTTTSEPTTTTIPTTTPEPTTTTIPTTTPEPTTTTIPTTTPEPTTTTIPTTTPEPTTTTIPTTTPEPTTTSIPTTTPEPTTTTIPTTTPEPTTTTIPTTTPEPTTTTIPTTTQQLTTTTIPTTTTEATTTPEPTTTPQPTTTPPTTAPPPQELIIFATEADDDSKPISDADVALYRFDNRGNLLDPLIGMTDKDGLVALPVPEREHFVIYVNKPGYIESSETFIWVPFGRNMLNFKLRTEGAARIEEVFTWYSGFRKYRNFDANGEIYTVELPPGALDIEEGSDVRLTGLPVNVSDPEDLKRAPGLLANSLSPKKNGGNVTHGLEVYGMAEFRIGRALTSESIVTESLDVLRAVKLVIPITGSTEDLSNFQKITAWYFDESMGYWREEGKGTVKLVGGKWQWEYLTKRFTWWAAGRKFMETSCAIVRTCYDPDCNEPVPFMPVTMTGTDFAYTTSKLTDVKGKTCFNFKLGGSVRFSSHCDPRGNTVDLKSKKKSPLCCHDNFGRQLVKHYVKSKKKSNKCPKVTLHISDSSISNSCEDPNIGADKSIEYSYTGRAVGSIATASCKSKRREIKGVDTHICLECGRWSGMEPKCVRMPRAAYYRRHRFIAVEPVLTSKQRETNL